MLFLLEKLFGLDLVFFDDFLMDFEEKLTELVVLELDVGFLEEVLELGAKGDRVLVISNGSLEVELFSAEVEFNLDVGGSTVLLLRLLWLQPNVS